MTTRIVPIAPRLSWDVLAPDDVEQIHEATLEILEATGVRFPSPRALDALEQNGCEVDRASQIARVPRAVVMDSVARAPREFVLAGRDPSADILLDGRHCYLGNDGSGVFVHDHRTGEKRPSTKNDVATSARHRRARRRCTGGGLMVSVRLTARGAVACRWADEAIHALCEATDADPRTGELDPRPSRRHDRVGAGDGEK